MLFFAQKQVLNFAFNPGFLIWAPNFLIGLLALILLVSRRRL
jgi:lipopolysaccharide export LptBFGC system permease protein LptF